MLQYSLSEDLTAGSTLDLDLKVDGLLPLKTSCPMCGGNCTINIPVVKQKVSFAMPPCPIKKGAGERNALPPLPFTCLPTEIFCARIEYEHFVHVHVPHGRYLYICTSRLKLRALCTRGCAWLCVRAGGNSTAVTLPADPLKSGKVSIKGTISVTDQSKANVASIMLDLTVE